MEERKHLTNVVLCSIIYLTIELYPRPADLIC